MFSRPQPLSYGVYAALAGAVMGFCVQILATVRGAALFIPSWAQGAVVLAIAVTVLLLAWQTRSQQRAYGMVRDPFRAVRILIAARAAALLGALTLGFAAGLLLWILPRLAHVAVTVWGPTTILALCAVVAYILGVIAERWCMLPPADDGTAAESAAS